MELLTLVWKWQLSRILITLFLSREQWEYRASYWRCNSSLFFFHHQLLLLYIISKTLNQECRNSKSLKYWCLLSMCVLLNLKLSKLPSLIVEKLPQVELSKLPNPMQRMKVARETRGGGEKPSCWQVILKEGTVEPKQIAWRKNKPEKKTLPQLSQIRQLLCNLFPNKF